MSGNQVGGNQPNSLDCIDLTQDKITNSDSDRHQKSQTGQETERFFLVFPSLMSRTFFSAKFRQRGQDCQQLVASKKLSETARILSILAAIQQKHPRHATHQSVSTQKIRLKSLNWDKMSRHCILGPVFCPTVVLQPLVSSLHQIYRVSHKNTSLLQN